MRNRDKAQEWLITTRSLALRVTFVFSFLVLFSGSIISAAEKKKIRVQKDSKEVVAYEDEGKEGVTDFSVSRIRVNSSIGINVLGGKSAVIMGGQIGYAVWAGTPFFVGPEVNFSLFSPGSLLGILGGGWYEIRIFGSPRLSLNGGLLAGLGIPSDLIAPTSTTLCFFLDSSLVQEVSDLVSVRGIIRPGIIDSRFSFIMSLGVSFRFQ